MSSRISSLLAWFWPPPWPSQRSVRRHTARLRSRTGRRTRLRLCPGRIGVRSGLHAQPIGDGGDFRRPDRPARNPAALGAGTAREAEDFVVDALAACAGLAAAGLDWASGARDDAGRRPDATIPAGGMLREDRSASCVFLVDDLDDPARARLHDHAAFIDDRIVIFGVARHRPQHDRRPAAARRPRPAREPRLNGRAGAR